MCVHAGADPPRPRDARLYTPNRNPSTIASTTTTMPKTIRAQAQPGRPFPAALLGAGAGEASADNTGSRRTAATVAADDGPPHAGLLASPSHMVCVQELIRLITTLEFTMVAFLIPSRQVTRCNGQRVFSPWPTMMAPPAYCDDTDGDRFAGMVLASKRGQHPGHRHVGNAAVSK